MAVTETGRLRLLLGEVVPSGGTEADTMFTDEFLQELITTYGEGAVLEGWRIKAAHYAELVDTVESGAQRKMSDLHKNALAMWKAYGGEAAVEVVTPTRRPTRSKRIVRKDYTE